MSVPATIRRPWLPWTGLWIAAAGLLALAMWQVDTGGKGPPRTAAASTPEVAPEAIEPPRDRALGVARSPSAEAADFPGMPPEFHRKYPPSSRIPMCIPFVRKGIEISPGLFVPPLNGVHADENIPPIGRSPRLPPPGPVVAKVISPDGQEYWEHEDGSATSCTYSTIQKPDGTKERIVATQHGAIPNRGKRGTLGR